MFRSGQILKLPDRLSLHVAICFAWFVLFGIAAVFTLFFCAWQGFSPDGPPPGFKPEPVGWFFAKNFPLALLGVMIQFWWFSFPLLGLTLWEFLRSRKPRRKRVHDYDL